MARKTKSDLRYTRQKRLIARLRKKETWMKWGLIGALVLIILLLLLLGYVTDWGRGLKKTTTPITGETSQVDQGAGAPAAPGGGSSGGASGGTNTRPSTNNTDRTTTNNSSTTTNNTSTVFPSSVDKLISDTNIGGSIDEVMQRASQLGVGASCTDQLLVKECTFTGGGQTFETKSVSGVVTSVLPQ